MSFTGINNGSGSDGGLEALAAIVATKASIAYVDSVAGDLDLKQDQITSDNTLQQDLVTDLPADLASKASTADLTVGLAGKQDTIGVDGLAIAQVAGLQDALDAASLSGGGLSNEEITALFAGKQDTIGPGDLLISYTSGLQTALDSKAVAADVNTSLAGKQDTILDGGLTIAKTAGLQTALNSKAAVADLVTSLASKQDVIADADLSIAKTDGLQAALDSKASSADLAGKQDVIADGGLNIAKTAGLQAALDSKASSADLAGKQDVIADGGLSIAKTAGLQAALDSKASSADLAGKQDVIADGGLSIAKTAGLQAALDSKASSADMAGKQDVIADGDLSIAKTDGLQAALDSKQGTLSSVAGGGVQLFHDQTTLRRIIAENGLSVSVPIYEDAADPRNYNIVVSGAAMETAIANLQTGTYTRAEVDQLLADLVNGAPGVLDTLQEIAGALGNDSDFSVTVTNQIAAKQDALVSQAGSGFELLHSGNVLRRIICEDGLTATVPLDLNDPNNPRNFQLVISAADLQSSIAQNTSDIGVVEDDIVTLNAGLADRYTKSQSDTRYYTKGQTDGLIAGVTLSSSSGDGASILESSNELRRITGADGIAVTQVFNVGNGTTAVEVSGATLETGLATAQTDIATAQTDISSAQSDITQLQLDMASTLARTDYEISRVFAMNSDGATIGLTIDFPPGEMHVERPLVANSSLSVAGDFSVSRSGVDVFEVNSNGNLKLRSVTAGTDIATTQDNNSGGYLRVHRPLLCDRVRAIDGQAGFINLELAHNDVLMTLNDSGIVCERALEAPELQADSLVANSSLTVAGTAAVGGLLSSGSGDNQTISINNTAGNYSSLYFSASGVFGQLFAGGGSAVLGTNSTHPLHIHCDRFNSSPAGLTVSATNDVAVNKTLTVSGVVTGLSPVQAPEFQAGGLRVHEQTGIINVGSLVHPSALQLAVSSQATPAASEVLLSAESSTGVTVNTGLHIAGNCTISGSLSVGSFTIPPKEAFDAYNSVDGALNPFPGTVVQVALDTVRHNTGSFSLSGSTLTIGNAGLYQLTFRVSTANTSGLNRSVSRANLALNGSPVLGTRVFMYNRQAGGGHNTGTGTCVLSLNAGDQLQINAGMIISSSNDTYAYLAEGCGLTIVAI